MSDILLAEYGTNQINLHLEGGVFNPGQEKYHIKWTYKFNDREQWFEYELTPSTGQLPAVRFGYTNMDIAAAPAYYYIVTPPEVRIFLRLFLGASTGVDSGILSGTLVDQGGDTIIGTTPAWNGYSGQLFGTVSDSNVDITIEADFPIFCTDWSLDTDAGATGDCYKCTSITDDNDRVTNCVSGDMSDAEDAQNYTSIANTIPHDKIYFIRNILKKNGTVVAHKHYRFRVPPNAKLALYATEHDADGQTINMRLKATGLGLPPTFMYMDMESTPLTWVVAHLLTATLSEYYYGEWTNYNNGDWYKVIGTTKAGNTNIPVFASEEQADEYLDGLRGEDTALNSGDLNVGGNISTGDDLESSDIPNPVIAGSGTGCNVWLLDSGNLNAIFNDLYDDTQTTIDAIKEGVWLWGNNPIDFIIRMYYVPFDVSSFYDTVTDRVWLGHYDTGHDYTKAKETKSSGQRITLVNQTIDNVYGDFRDIDFFKYDLFLPYVGFVPLDPAVYVGHTLKVEMAFNVMTHDIRYYLFVDGVLTDRVDGSVGYDIPLLGTDMVNKANNDINGIINTAKGGLEFGLGVASGNVAMAGKGTLDAFNGIRSTLQYPKEIIRGDISSSMNIYDINYVYLKITEKQSIYPPEITQIYNFPSYVAGTLGQLSGYCEITNIQLKSNCTESEYNEILNLLEGGVIF